MAPSPNSPPVLRSVSPSQIKQFDPESEGGCNRKHWLNKRCGIPMPQTSAQALGERVHKEVEDYLLLGKSPTHESVQHLIDRPGFPKRPVHPAVLAFGWDDFRIEFPRNYATGMNAAGVPVKMRMDLVDARDTRTVAVWDWKTSKNFGWASTPDELLKDPQCLKYTYWAATRFPTASDFVFYHGYVSTAPDYDRSASPDSRIVATPKITRDDVLRRYASIVEPKVERMKEVFALESLADIEPNWDACGAFGGCPYRDVCGPRPVVEVPEEILPNPTEVQMQEAEDLIAARKAMFKAKRDEPLVQETTLGPSKVRAVGINPPDAAKPVPVTPYVPAEETAPVQTPPVSAKERFLAALTQFRAAILEFERALLSEVKA